MISVVGVHHGIGDPALSDQAARAAALEGGRLVQQQLKVQLDDFEWFMLATCNRTILVSTCLDSTRLLQVYSAVFLNDTSRSKSQKLHYWVWQEALEHILSLGCGMVSKVPGEPEILGQIKKAYSLYRELGFVGPVLSRVMPQVFSAAKQIRTSTQLGQMTLSLSKLILNCMDQIFSKRSQVRVVCVGAGQVIQQVAGYLHERGIVSVNILSRSAEHACDVATPLGYSFGGLDQTATAVLDADVVIAATASPYPVIGKGLIERTQKHRKNAPLLLIDLAVPQDIEQEVERVSNVYLFTLSQLQDTLAQHQENRQQAIDQARPQIENWVQSIMQATEGQDSTICELREHAQQLKTDVLKKATTRLAKGEAVEQVLEQALQQLANKLLHQPTVWLKKSPAEKKSLIRELFNL